jgi:hypothetical protein
MVQLGYYNRSTSWLIYLGCVLAFFAFHLYFINSKKKVDVLRIAFIVAVLTLLSYPLLSHDLFNYMFTGKIVTHYGANPYMMRALDYPHDHWTRFMHWTHVTYPYGPTFLPLILIPSFIGFAKFSLTYVLFKIFFAFFYFISVYFLNKIDKWSALFFATHPLIIIEALINNHNDIVAVGLSIVGIYLLSKQKNIGARIFLLLSGGVKYITLPLIILSKPQKKHPRFTRIALAGLIITIFAVSYQNGIYPWYFLNCFLLLPYLGKHLKNTFIISAGLLLSYYPFIALGEWDESRLATKNIIIISAAVLNVAYLFYLKQTKEVV